MKSSKVLGLIRVIRMYGFLRTFFWSIMKKNMLK